MKAWDTVGFVVAGLLSTLSAAYSQDHPFREGVVIRVKTDAGSDQVVRLNEINNSYGYLHVTSHPWLFTFQKPGEQLVQLLSLSPRLSFTRLKGGNTLKVTFADGSTAKGAIQNTQIAVSSRDGDKVLIRVKSIVSLTVLDAPAHLRSSVEAMKHYNAGKALRAEVVADGRQLRLSGLSLLDHHKSMATNRAGTVGYVGIKVPRLYLTKEVTVRDDDVRHEVQFSRISRILVEPQRLDPSGRPAVTVLTREGTELSGFLMMTIGGSGKALSEFDAFVGADPYGFVAVPLRRFKRVECKLTVIEDKNDTAVSGQPERRRAGRVDAPAILTLGETRNDPEEVPPALTTQVR